MADIVIYIASKQQSKDFQQRYKDIPTLKIGTFDGMDTNPHYFDTLFNQLAASSDAIDTVIFDQADIAQNGHSEAALEMLLKSIETGLTGKIAFISWDNMNVINEQGHKIFENAGIRNIVELTELGPVFAESEKPQPNGETRQSASIEMTEKQAPEREKWYTSEDEMYHIDKYVDDPFAGLLTSEDDFDPFSEQAAVSIFDAYDSTSYVNPDEEEYDPFADESFTLSSPNSSYSGTCVPEVETYSKFPDNNGYMQQYPANMYRDNIDPFESLATISYEDFEHEIEQAPPLPEFQDPSASAVYSGEFTESDITSLIAIHEPNWDYSQLNESLANAHGKRKGKKNLMGEVDPTMLQSSTYIREMEQRDGYYSPPTDTKIICVYAPIGGCGKTTISTMIAAQLNWCFNRKLMMQQTMTMSARVLVLSLNEFDDIAVKEIGYEGLLAPEGDGKNVAELKSKIEECNGEPEWEDIRHCFPASRQNYVFYLPSMTLREKFDADIDITADDYKKIIEVCSRFFQFIILDTPDVFYDQRNGLMEFAFSVSDIICFVMEADTKSSINMYRLFDGWKSKSAQVPLNREKCMLVVNKYATPDNPYLGYQPEHPQLDFKQIADSMVKHFKNIEAVPLTEYRAYGNILFGRDPKVKQAAADITDDILQMIDENDAKGKKKRS